MDELLLLLTNGLFQHLRIELLTNARRETLGGREYVVADAVILRQQVLNGSDGPLFYPLDEINQDVGVWNGYPLTAGHPFVLHNGERVNVSARVAKIAHEFQIGTLYNDRMVGNERLVEAWFDVQNANRIDSRIIPAVLAGQPINVSTGIFTKKRQAVQNANYNGTGYSHSVFNIRPDHLAVLMNERGACSVRDGCGINVPSSGINVRNAEMECVLNTEGVCVNCGGKGGKPGPCPSGVGDTHKGHETVRAAVATLRGPGMQIRTAEQAHQAAQNMWFNKSAVQAAFPGKKGHIDFADAVKSHWESTTNNTITENADMKCPKCGKTMSDGKCECGYKAPTANAQATISWLTTNCDCWKGKDTVLANLGEEELSRIKTNEEGTRTLVLVTNSLKEAGLPVDKPLTGEVIANHFKSQTDAAVKKAVEDTKKTTTNTGDKPVEITQEMLTNALKGMKEGDVLALFPTLNTAVKTAQGVIDEKRYEIMRQLVANVSDQKEKERKLLLLKDKTLPVLNEMLEFAVINTPEKPKDDQASFLANFFGQAGGPSDRTQAGQVLNRADILPTAPEFSFND